MENGLALVLGTVSAIQDVAAKVSCTSITRSVDVACSAPVNDLAAERGAMFSQITRRERVAIELK